MIDPHRRPYTSYRSAKNIKSKIRFRPLWHIFCFASLTFSTCAVSEILSPYVERFEPVAQNASTPGNSYLSNDWGLHQPRITSHSDGTVRLIYLSNDSSNRLFWRLMRRNPSGEWAQESSGYTTDDVALLRDARNDYVHVLAWPSSIPTTYTSPFFEPSPIPGEWQVLPSHARHYGNAGIGSDGTLCLKVSRELRSRLVTSNTKTEYACGNFSAASREWSWSEIISRHIGLRHSYDYIFPNPSGLQRGLYATSTRDIYKTASEVPSLDPTFGNYVFNGIRHYSTGLNSDNAWGQTDIRLSFQRSTSARMAPTLRLHESFIDSRGRIFSNYYTEMPRSSNRRGLYTSVTDGNGIPLIQKHWQELPSHGYTRLYEDAKNRLWLLWSGQGNRRTHVKLYRILESESGFSLGESTDLDESFYPYSIQGSIYIAAPRGGNNKNLFIDGIFNACSTIYSTRSNFNNSRCYSQGKQRVFYVRIRLPD